jgi:selenocysteine lyase/cysteine desulfurase
MPYFPEAPPAPPVPQVTDFEQYVQRYRASLPVLRNCLYLNHASVGPLSDWVIDAANEHLRQQQMAETTTQDDWYDGWRLARQRIAELIGATKDEVCLQPNTWAALTRAFSALPLDAGDEVLFPVEEFPCLYHALSELRVRGCRVVPVEATRPDGIVRSDDLLNSITARTRLIATSWVNFLHGYRHDLDRLGTACRERGIWLAIDAIQGLGMLPLDVKRSGVHFVACNGAKWLCSPLGSGFLYVSDDVPPEITPRLEGWFAMELNHESYMDRTVRPKTNANRFATGTVPLSAAFGLRRSCEILLEAGPQRASQRAIQLADMLAKAASASNINVISLRDEAKTAIVSLRLADCPMLPEKLLAANVAFSIREGAVRLSPHWYLLRDEIQPVCEIIAGSAAHC